MEQIKPIQRIPFNLNLHKLNKQIDAKTELYTAILISLADRLDFLNEELQKKELKKKRKTLLQKEFVEREHHLFKVGKMLTESKLDSKKYNAQLKEWTTLCEQNFDDYLLKAREIAKDNMVLRTTLLQYSNPENDTILKVEFFLWLCNIIEKNKYKK